MTFNLSKHKNDLLFCPLGGSGEIGMNMNLYYMDGKWLMIDYGAGFAEDYLPGIDMIVPDISFIEKYKDDLLGVVITHAHEDHLGAIPYIWEELGMPIYATPFTAAFLREKLGSNHPACKKGVIREIQQGSKFELGPFDLELVQITHSVPEMNAVLVRTKFGNIFHSGDWKLDPKPVVGAVSDFDKMRKIGDEGVLAMISDSTNVFSPGTSGSEGDLQESLIELVGQCKKMVIVTTFASNVARVVSIAEAARKNGRKVILAGRSLWRIVAAAKASGYLKDAPEFHEATELKRFKREEVLIISTGCQGEPMAATSKIATGNHRDITVRPEDSIIFSSKIIPGNDKRIFRLFNQFIKLGAEVLTEKDHFVHVSGHPNVDDMHEMYKMIRPQVAIPVHGEHVHMHEHVRLAKSWGVPSTIQVGNGDVVRLGPGAPEKITMVKAGEMGVDGNFLLSPDSKIMRMRRKLQRDGVLVVTLILNKHGEPAIRPIVSAPGTLDPKEDDDIFEDIMFEIEEALADSVKSSKKSPQEDRIENITRSATRRVLKAVLAKNPPIEVNIKRI